MAQVKAIGELCSGVRVSMPVSAGFVEPVQRITRGELQLADSSADLMASLCNGTMVWEGKPNKDLRCMIVAPPVP
jgi:TRAP-type uncharacterized transport system substrate-binding protein